MRLSILLLCLAGLAAAPQDDARVTDLIQKLEDDAFDVREQAQKDLVKIGEPALAALRKALERTGKESDKGELKIRSEATVREIELAIKAAKVYRDPRLVTISAKEQDLGKLLEEIGRQAGVTLDASAIDRSEKVSLEAKGLPLFQVLDRLCVGSRDRTFELRKEGTVTFLKEPHVPCPSAYSGPVRVRVTRADLQRATDFKTRTSSLKLTLEADYERYLAPFGKPEIDLKAVDEEGKAVEVAAGHENDNVFQNAGGRIFVMGAMMALDDGADRSRPFTLKSIAPGTTKVTLRGKARLVFPLDTREVKFEKPQSGATVDAGPYRVKLERTGPRNSWTISIQNTARDPGTSSTEDVERRVMRESLVAVDEDGTEHTGAMEPGRAGRSAISVINGKIVTQEGAGSFDARFATLRGKAVKELRFKFVDATFPKEFPFEIRDLELP